MSYTKQQRSHNALTLALREQRLRFDLDASKRFHVHLSNSVQQRARVSIERGGLFVIEMETPTNRRHPVLARGILSEADDVAALIASWCRRARKGAIL